MDYFQVTIALPYPLTNSLMNFRYKKITIPCCANAPTEYTTIDPHEPMSLEESYLDNKRNTNTNAIRKRPT